MLGAALAHATCDWYPSITHSVVSRGDHRYSLVYLQRGCGAASVDTSRYIKRSKAELAVPTVANTLGDFYRWFEATHRSVNAPAAVLPPSISATTGRLARSTISAVSPTAIYSRPERTSDTIKITVRSQRGDGMCFKISRHTPMIKLFQAYANEEGVKQYYLQIRQALLRWRMGTRWIR
jgi:hypothetical protein